MESPPQRSRRVVSPAQAAQFELLVSAALSTSTKRRSLEPLLPILHPWEHPRSGWEGNQS